MVPGTDSLGESEDDERADGLKPLSERCPSGCTRRGWGGGVISRPGSGSLEGSMSGQSGLVREDGPALAAFRRCTGQVYPEYAAVRVEVVAALPPWIGHGRSGKPASVPAGTRKGGSSGEGANRAEVRGEPGEKRLTRPARDVGSAVAMDKHGSKGLAGCAPKTPGFLVQHAATRPP